MVQETYRITHQKLGTALNEDGTGFTQQWNVGYMVTSGPAEGVRGEVHATTTNLNPEHIHQAIGTMVAKHTQVAALGNA